MSVWKYIYSLAAMGTRFSSVSLAQSGFSSTVTFQFEQRLESFPDGARLGGAAPVDLPMTLANKSQTPVRHVSLRQEDVKVFWSLVTGLKAGPPEAELSTEELGFYGTARNPN